MKAHITGKISLLALALFLCNCQNLSNSNNVTSDINDYSDSKSSIERGLYLCTLMDCNTCHTPKMMTDKGPVPDMSKMLSGYPADLALPEIDKSEITPGKWVLMTQELTATVGPWGVSFAANLTPHETGIGNWSFENFSNSMTKGMHKGMEGTRPVLPPMPWQSFSSLTQEDLKAIWKYLQSIPPYDNVVPTAIPMSDL